MTNIIRGRKLKAKKVHLRGHNLVISKPGGEYQVPSLLKMIEKTKNMKRQIKVIKVIKRIMNQLIKITKIVKNMRTMIKNTKMEVKKMIMVATKITTKRLIEKIKKLKIVLKRMRVMMKERIPTTMTIKNTIHKQEA